MTCKLCKAQPVPYFGEGIKSERRHCAFDDAGVFTPDNWNCATISPLRNAAAEHAVWNDDQWAGLVPIDYTEGGGFHLLLTWYKSRGRTEGAWVVADGAVRPLTLADAEAWLAKHPQPTQAEGLA